MKEKILGVDVCVDSYEGLITKILEDIDQKRKSLIVAINPEKIMKAQEDPDLHRLLNSATYQIPDGIGVILASKLKKGSIRNRITGIDMMLKLCEAARDHHKKVFLYGAKPGVAETAKRELEAMYPGIEIVGTMDGYQKNQEVVKDAINQSQADILFVAMGSPAQENWILANMNDIFPSIFQGVGGSFDVISGNLKRAPKGFQSLGLEWLYRLLKEPWRWKRQLILPAFLVKALRD
ncbi:WecB/TagA/CpsF family glycosyltransferase [Bacillus timonensis]|uniref:WecB/TagA/CpsF family glycosyltransferase n=1 Tax=Bacillus timonensis TaxID=1033734 RepID=UPI0002882C0C|nr:WecB/TagA/CpsF family glycosyltransferase [Bacillus timonensis]